MYRPIQERFWEKVDVYSGLPCWLWNGAHDKWGYGSFRPIDRTVKSHRYVLELIAGYVVPADKCVLHNCDTPACVRPQHLYIGTRGDNARDMASRGRQFYQKNPDLVIKGSSHPQARLTEDAVQEIRRLSATGMRQVDIARRFGIAQPTVSDIALRRYWKHVQ